MDILVNKLAKDFLRRRFEDWYSQQITITKQLQGSEIESVDLQPINLGLPILKELGARWMVEMAEYFADNPQIIVNGFVMAGIAGALDGHADEQEGEQNAGEDETDSEEYESDEWQVRMILCCSATVRGTYLHSRLPPSTRLFVA